MSTNDEKSLPLEINPEKFHENRIIRGLENRLQLLQVDVSSLNDQIRSTSLDNVRLQREVITLRRDKSELQEENIFLKKKCVNCEELQYEQKIHEFKRLLTIAEGEIQSQASMMSKYQFDISQLTQELSLANKLRNKAETQAENEAQYVTRVSHTLGEDLKGANQKLQETQSLLKLTQTRVTELERTVQGLTLQNEEKTNSFNERLCTLCVSISQKDDLILSLERKVNDLQTENSENDVEIHTLFKAKKELQNDIQILTEAFTKRGEMVRELEGSYSLLNIHLSKQITTIESQKEQITQLELQLKSFQLMLSKEMEENQQIKPKYLFFSDAYQNLQEEHKKQETENETLKEISRLYEILQRDHSKLQLDYVAVSQDLHGLQLLYQETATQLSEMSLKYQEANKVAQQHEALNNQYLELRREREQLYEAFVEMRGEMGTLKTVIME